MHRQACQVGSAASEWDHCKVPPRAIAQFSVTTSGQWAPQGALARSLAFGDPSEDGFRHLHGGLLGDDT